MIDNLTFGYNGNRRTKVTDAITEQLTYEGCFDFVDGTNTGNDYTYNANGALIKDLNKDITKIEYDLLGNPKKVTMTDSRSIEYVYSADGRRLRAVHKSGSLSEKTDYIGSLILKNGKRQMYRFSGGYASFDADTINGCHYYIADYLGNNRMVVNASTDEVEQVSHYYAYGGIIGNLSSNEGLQEFKFGDKKLDRTYGLDLYDFEARQYDAIAPWFTSIDPLAEKYYSISPYAYCAGDPVNLVDPTGMDWYRNDSTGNYTWFSEVKDRDGYTYVGEKGSMLGELEGLVDDALREWSEKEEKGLYEDNTKVRIDNKEVSSFMDWFGEFIFNSGPEITIVTNHSNPYIQDLKKEEAVIASENIARKKGYSATQTPQWMPWDHFYRGIKRPITNYLGTYQIRSYSLKNINMETLSLAYDRKSAYSLFLHQTENNRRSNSSYLGNTYQFYFLIK